MSIKGNTVGTTLPRPDWNQTDPSKGDYIKGRDALEQLINEAKAAAEQAQAAAVDAQTAAVNAVQLADNARARADDAQTYAHEAKTAADNAQGSADTTLVTIEDHVANKDNVHEVTCEQIGAVNKNGDTMSGTLSVNGLILTEDVDYGTTLPEAGTKGRLFFKKV